MRHGLTIAQTAASCLGTLSIDGVELVNCPAWTILSLAPLYDSPDTRGENVVIPGNHGSYPTPRRRAERVVNLDFVLLGTVDRSGTPYSDQNQGLTRNIRYLRDNVIDPIDTGDGCRTATMVDPDGRSWVGRVQVQPLRIGSTGKGYALCTFGLLLPEGDLIGDVS